MMNCLLWCFLALQHVYQGIAGHDCRYRWSYQAELPKVIGEVLAEQIDERDPESQRPEGAAYHSQYCLLHSVDISIKYEYKRHGYIVIAA